MIYESLIMMESKIVTNFDINRVDNDHNEFSQHISFTQKYLKCAWF